MLEAAQELGHTWRTRWESLRLFPPAEHDALPGRMQARGEFLVSSSRRVLQRAGVRFRPRLVDAAGRTVRFADGTSREVGVVVWATGFRPDYSWNRHPGPLCGRRRTSPSAGPLC